MRIVLAEDEDAVGARPEAVKRRPRRGRRGQARRAPRTADRPAQQLARV